MASSLNRAEIIGNLGKDPEIRQTQDGKKVATLNVATSESWTDKRTGDKQTATEWHRVVVFNENMANLCETALRKGSKVYIAGQLKTRKWTDNSGVERYTTEIVLSQYRGEIVLLDRRQDGQDAAAPEQTQNTRTNDGFDDEIPF